MSECRKDEGVEECGGMGVGQGYCRRAGGMRPRVMAFMTMSAALVAPSLRMMWLRWDSTVPAGVLRALSGRGGSIRSRFCCLRRSVTVVAVRERSVTAAAVRDVFVLGMVQGISA